MERPGQAVGVLDAPKKSWPRCFEWIKKYWPCCFVAKKSPHPVVSPTKKSSDPRCFTDWRKSQPPLFQWFFVHFFLTTFIKVSWFWTYIEYETLIPDQISGYPLNCLVVIIVGDKIYTKGAFVIWDFHISHTEIY